MHVSIDGVISVTMPESSKVMSALGSGVAIGNGISGESPQAESGSASSKIESNASTDTAGDGPGVSGRLLNSG